jgi:hypothetical protein
LKHLKINYLLLEKFLMTKRNKFKIGGTGGTSGYRYGTKALAAGAVIGAGVLIGSGVNLGVNTGIGPLMFGVNIGGFFAPRKPQTTTSGTQTDDQNTPSNAQTPANVQAEPIATQTEPEPAIVPIATQTPASAEASDVQKDSNGTKISTDSSIQTQDTYLSGIIRWWRSLSFRPAPVAPTNTEESAPEEITDAVMYDNTTVSVDPSYFWAKSDLNIIDPLSKGTDPMPIVSVMHPQPVYPPSEESSAVQTTEPKAIEEPAKKPDPISATSAEAARYFAIGTKPKKLKAFP